MPETPPSTVTQDHRVQLPYTRLHAMVPFLEEGSLTTIAGPTGEGKTTLALDLLRHAAAAGHRTLYLHSSQNEEGIRVRLLAAEAEVSNTQIRTNDLDPQARQRLEQAQQRMGTWPLDLRHRSAWTLEAIRNEAGWGNHDLVIVDDTDQISVPETPLAERFFHISATLRELPAGETPAVVAVTQMDPPGEHAGGFTGEERLRQLGHRYPLAQDSSLVILTDLRDAALFRRGSGLRLSMHVAKNRHGATGRAEAKAEMHFCRCVDLTDEESAADPWQ
ncbi:DnaB-like helicase C-terminal domain-containing protein [Nocardiopsis sp. CNS-639]|uniref:DnaB-like helicase C-terminal domain-containing protein n=1 Tax=Nocardiopsis sp. CNS-639 TaxID=1169153 RepID=UPI000371DB5A